jgi:hypothetical protein
MAPDLFLRIPGPPPICPTYHPLGHPAQGAGRRYRGRPSGAGSGPGPSLERRVANRRHRAPSPDAPEQASPNCTRHYTREPVAAPDLGRPVLALRAPRACCRGRMARAHGLETGGADRAGVGPAPPLAPSPAHLGPLRYPRQPQHRSRHPARYESGRRAAPRSHCPRPRPQGTRGRFADSRDHGTLSLVGADRSSASPRGHRGRRGGTDLTGFHQHPGHGGALVSGHPLGPARLGRSHRAAPRFARPGHSRMGGRRNPRRPAPLCGLHLDPGSGSGLHPGRSGAPGGKPQSGRAADSARRPERPPAGCGESADLRTD